MHYNFDFLYASIVICLVIGVHAFFSSRNFRGMLPRWVRGVVAVSLFVTLADILDSLFIENSAQVGVVALYAADIMLYVTQLSLPLMLYRFTLRITGAAAKGYWRILADAPIVLYAVTCLIVITTPWTGLVFSFDTAAGHAYSHGIMMLLPYTCGALLGIGVFVLMITNRKFIRRIDCLTICFDVFILVAVAIIQMLVPSVCLIGFAAAIGSLALYMSFNDSSGLGDTKTGCFEPAEFRRRIAALLKRETHFNVICIVIDNRRYLSNNLGSDILDDVLLHVGQGLMDRCRTEQVYKFHGARFCALLYDDDATARLRDEIDAWLARPFEVDDASIALDARVTALYSVCNIASHVDLETFMDFLIDEIGSADEGHVDQKALTKRYNEFHDACEALEYAIAHNTFEIFLQPLYTVQTGRYASAEVLSRLRDRDGKYIPPSQFISIAEEDGAIGTLSNFQFHRLCGYLAEHREELKRVGLTDVKYNVSAVELVNPEQGRYMVDLARTYGLDPHVFTFEITESVAYEGKETLASIIADIKAAGCRVYMDDFGSGFANMETIFRLPFDGVKLDISLLRLVRTDENAANFYHGLVDMIHSLGKIVVSEGVETAEEAEMLAAWGVDVIQGFYYSRPLPVDDFLAFLQEHAD